ncbi:hypothetical protein LOK49_LG04G01426 [Camellia lanceoleosa]|uniref:Uncharacterized protein n=1 Tax=Camellia lanceoleosa TaxID=1840588 RepID=A0ACC0HXP0_9ERIC|nr:hypothetical protein LOK49_LG04G01426 [Camellia lanceoleosa]
MLVSRFIFDTCESSQCEVSSSTAESNQDRILKVLSFAGIENSALRGKLVPCHIDGKILTSEETIVAVDKKNKSMTYNLIGGDLMKLYKEINVTSQATTIDEKNCLTWICEYEKLNENVYAPHQLKDFVTQVTNTIDANFRAFLEPERELTTNFVSL